MSPREHDLERRNLETDDVAIHDGIFLSVTNGYTWESLMSTARKNRSTVKKQLRKERQRGVLNGYGGA